MADPQWNRDFSAKNIKKMRDAGHEVPRTDTKANYRKDMAQIDRTIDRGNKERDPFVGKTPSRYYRNFDRGAKRASSRSSGRK